MYSDTPEKACPDEEIELRDLITKNLEDCGFLNKIKAELRAGVFLALEEDGSLKDKIPLLNKKLDDFISTSEGKLLVSLIREFFEFFNLNFTLSVFNPEVAASVPRITRSELCDQVNIKDLETDNPVIFNVLKEVIDKNKKIPNKFFSADSAFEKSILDENVTEKLIIEDVLNRANAEKEEKRIFTKSGDDSFFKIPKADSKSDFPSTESVLKSENDNKKHGIASGVKTDKIESEEVKKENGDSIFKESNNKLSLDHDPFFDEPLPSEKSSFFTFKDKPESKLSSSIKKDLPDTKKSSLSSLKDLPSLISGNEWTFSRDPKNALPSFDSLKSVSSSEASNEEIINLDSKDVFEKKNLDIVESNEEMSEKQNSDESIEEELEEDSSVNFDELMNSSLSLGDDQTTDQTVSQVSIVEGTDHVEST